MKFKVKASGFIAGIDPAVEVSTKNAIKDFDSAGRVGFRATSSGLVIYAWNGRISIQEILSENNTDNLDYEFIKDGDVVVSSKDIKDTLSSFRSDDLLLVEIKNAKSGGSEVCICRDQDNSEYQTLPIINVPINMPPTPKNFSKTLTIRRDIFLRGINKIFFAVGFEQERERYLYWVLRSFKDHVRFVAGSGARFAAMDFEGSNIVSEEGLSFLMPKEQTAVFSRVLSNLDDESLTVAESKGGDQIFMSTSSCEMVLVGLRPGIKWIDENILMDVDYPVRYITAVDDWSYAGRGTLATYDEILKNQRRPHRAHVIANSSSNTITIETSEKMRSCRKVKIIDSDIGKEKDMEFNVSSVFLYEISRNADDQSGKIQIEFTPSENGKYRPVLVRFYASDKVEDRKNIVSVNKSLGTKERFTLFFCPVKG